MSKCPFPGCWLEDWHDGEHLPRLRLRQHYVWFRSRCEIQRLQPSWPECRNVSIRMYETAQGAGVDLCLECEQELQYQGAMELGTRELERAA